MRKLPLFFGAGALALAGTAALAAGNSNLHTMTVKLPDGGAAKIEYSGNVAPKVDIRSGSPGEFAMLAPAFAFAGFPDVAQIEAAMDRQMSHMLREARAMMAMPSPGNMPFEANFGVAGSGNPGWFISDGSGGNFCSRSVEVTVINGKKTVRSRMEGHCGTAKGESAAAAHPGPAPDKSI